MFWTIGVGIPTLWTLPFKEVASDVCRVSGHEPAERGAVVPSAKVIKAGFRVAFFGGEFVERAARAAHGTADRFAVRVIVVAFKDGLVKPGHQTGRAQMVAVREVERAIGVFSQNAPIQVDIAAPPVNCPGSVLRKLRRRVTIKVVNIVKRGATRGPFDAVAKGVVDVAGRGIGAGAEGAVHLNEAVFGVVEISVAAVEGHVPGSVVPVGVIHRIDEAILGVHGGVELPTGPGRDGLVGAIAPGVVSPGKTSARLGGVGVGRGRQSVLRIVAVPRRAPGAVRS